MTLDFKKLLKNAIVKQMTIQHVEIPDRSIQIFKRDELITCQRITQRLQSIFGQNFMLDGDFWVFFSDQGSDVTFDKDFAEKTLFKVVNAGLGESANNMTEAELKMFSFEDDRDVPEKTTDDMDVTKDTDGDEANDRAVAGAIGGEESDEDVDDVLDESVEEPSSGEKFIFLKITMK